MDIGRITCPVMIVLGERDIFIGPEEITRVQEILPYIQTVLLPCGHGSFLELPEKFNSVVIKFLQDIECDSI